MENGKQLDYIEPKNGGNIDENCAFDHPAADKKFCPFEIESLDTCSPAKTDKKYGFPEKKPCIFLKLNKVATSLSRLLHKIAKNQFRLDFQLDSTIVQRKQH